MKMGVLRSLILIGVIAVTVKSEEGLVKTIVRCEKGVRDCDMMEESGECAPYNGRYEDPRDMHWTIALASIFGILMAFGIGANDAANSWATSVGSGAISLQRAVIIGGFMEFLGALTLGYGVSKTIQKGVAKVDDPECWACGFCDSNMSLLSAASMSALIGASLFLLSATKTQMPVSTTHSIVGGVIGVTISGTAASCLNWSIKKGLTAIMLSWVISPVLAGCFASSLFLLSQKFIMQSKAPVERAIGLVSALFGLSGSVMVFLIFFKSRPLKKSVPKGIVALIATFVGLTIAVLTYIFITPKIREQLPSVNPETREQVVKEGSEKQKTTELSEVVTDRAYSSNNSRVAKVDLSEEPIDFSGEKKPVTGQSSLSVVRVEIEDPGFKKGEAKNEEQTDAIYVFRWLLVFNALLESYGHGANDTANATGPFTSVYHTYYNGIHDCNFKSTPPWVMGIAGLFVWLGIATYGVNVIRTIGSKVIHIDFHKGFYIELGSNISVVIATLLELPVSTTHCQIGGVLFVGMADVGANGVDWSLMTKIFATWVLTLPIAGFISAILTAVIRAIM